LTKQLEDLKEEAQKNELKLEKETKNNDHLNFECINTKLELNKLEEEYSSFQKIHKLKIEELSNILLRLEKDNYDLKN